MHATAVVETLIEAAESPKDFLDRHDDLYVPGDQPTSRYHFNIGEGTYRCGIAFDILASSRREAVALANEFLQTFFYRAPGHSGALELAGDLPETESKNFRVYVDDEIMAAEADIAGEHEVAND